SPWVEKAVLELHFSLSWPRGDYKPFDTFVRLNGKKVGEILDTVPEGIYLFDIPRDLILCTADEILDNEIEITAPGINSADNILLKSYRLIVKRGLTQIPVFASDQEEADKLAGKYSADVNHGRADLCLSANNLDIPGGALRKGEKIRLDFDVHNLGETAAENVRLMLFRSDPSVAGFNERADKLAEAGLDTVEAGQAQKISLTFPFDPETVSSVHARLRSESSDFNLNNDGFRLSLIDGDSDLPTPLLGTDIPILFQAPSLLQVLEIRDLEGLKDFIVSAAYDKFWNSDLARSFDLEGIKEDLRERFRSDMRERFLERLDSIKDWLEKLRERRR
ncbi:MAG: hypothetical protein JW747_08865, partial [Candidatus Aminicenantes bacterium]|nr:hypothetical protein [Candidatus Aminicenantes bacterium]